MKLFIKLSILFLSLKTFQIYSLYFEPPHALKDAGINEQALLKHLESLWKEKAENGQATTKAFFSDKVNSMIDRLIESSVYYIKKKVLPISLINIQEPDDKIIPKNVKFGISFSNLNSFADYVTQSLELIYPKSIDKQYDLTWCSCRAFTPAERIFFIIQLIFDIEKNFKDKNKKLVFTSFASGGLLLDYLVIQELLTAGYLNLEINVMDTVFPSLADVPKTYKERVEKLEELKKAGNGKSIEAQNIESTLKIENFQLHISKLASLYKGNLNFKYYTDPYYYAAEVESGLKDKSDILLMVDPDRPAWSPTKNITHLESKNIAIIQDTIEEQFAYIINAGNGKFFLVNSQNFKIDKLKDNVSFLINNKKTFSLIDKTIKEKLDIVSLKFLDFYSSAHVIFAHLVEKTAQPECIIYTAADLRFESNNLYNQKNNPIKKLRPNEFNPVDYIDKTIVADLKFIRDNFIKNESIGTIYLPNMVKSELVKIY